MRRGFTYLVLFLVVILIILVFSNLGPSERTLGSHVRLVYLHGAWVWTALLGFLFAAVFGLLGLFSKRSTHHAWSIALGQAGLFFWATYLPLSLWTMQMNWNGLFLQEPRWKVSFDFAVVAILIQLAIVIINRPLWGSVLNLTYFLSLGWALLHTEQIMHPGSPITTSGSTAIQSFFGFLLLLCLLAAWSLAKWFRSISFNPQ